MEYRFAPAFVNKNLTFFYDYFVDFAFVGQQLQHKTLKVIGNMDKNSILDIGCGTGTLVNIIKGKYPSATVVGLDPDDTVLLVAKKKTEKNNRKIEFIKAKAEKLPFADASFDIVVSSLAFHHLPLSIKRQALKEIYRILKPKGKFLLVDIGKPKNFLWKILLNLEALIEPREYIKDNLEGKLPSLIKAENFSVETARRPYMGIEFLLATKR